MTKDAEELLEMLVKAGMNELAELRLEECESQIGGGSLHRYDRE